MKPSAIDNELTASFCQEITTQALARQAQARNKRNNEYLESLRTEMIQEANNGKNSIFIQVASLPEGFGKFVKERGFGVTVTNDGSKYVLYW